MTVVVQSGTLRSSGAVQGVHFNGSTYLSRGAQLNGIGDTQVGTISFWFKMAGTDSTAQTIIHMTSAGPTTRFVVRRDTDNTMLVYGVEQFDGNNLSMTSTTTYQAGMGWTHFIASWDTAAGVGYIYVNGSDVTAGGSILSNTAVAYSQTIDASVGSRTDGTAKLTGDIAYLWFTHGTYFNLTNSTNREKFRTAGGAPASLGANGETPTGSSPILYLSGSYSTWPTNDGTGGNFTTTAGALSAASSDPP